MFVAGILVALVGSVLGSSQYIKAEIGTNCDPEHLIANVSACKEAAEALESSLRDDPEHPLNATTLPAGCFFWNTNRGEINKKRP